MTKDKILLLISICIILFACAQSNLEECDCQKMTVWSIDCGILFPTNITKENIKTNPKTEITDKTLQDSFITAILKLTPTVHSDGIDNRFLIQIDCKNSRTIEIESNCSLTMYDHNYYTTSEDLVKLIKQNTKNTDLNK